MNAWECGACEALAKNALEMTWIVRLEQFGGARHMEIIQARHPEAIRARAQHVTPVPVFGGSERAHRLIGAQHGFEASVVELAGGEVDAPVVDGHGDVEEPLVAA